MHERWGRTQLVRHGAEHGEHREQRERRVVKLESHRRRTRCLYRVRGQSTCERANSRCRLSGEGAVQFGCLALSTRTPSSDELTGDCDSKAGGSPDPPPRSI